MLDRARSVRIAAANGILIPDVAWDVAAAAGLPFPIACSILMQETAGGRNIYGHDDTWMVGYGEVTECNYAVYRAHRDRFGSQGVGPCQITYWSLQDRADTYGGCWDPEVNCWVGFELLVVLHDSAVAASAPRPWWEAFRRYNGRESYADQVFARRAQWKGLLE